MTGQQRTRRLISGIASSLVSRGISLIAPLILIPFALQSMGAERYGLWTAAASLTAIALFSDLGLGNGLLTRLTKTYASGDVERARSLISSAYAMTGAIAALLLAGIAIGIPLLHPAGWLDPDEIIPSDEANAIVLVCLAAFAVNIPATMIQRVQYAYQQMTYSNIWAAGASLTSVAAFIAVSEMGGGTLGAISASVFALPVVGLINAVVFFGWQHGELSPIGVRPTWTYATNLMRLGSLFFALSVLTSISLNIDPLLVSRLLGLEATAEYSIGWKVASTLGLIVTLVNLPLWPANGEALAHGDVAWVRKATARMTLVSIGLVALGGLLLLGPGRALVDTWLGESSVRPSTGLLVVLVVWNLLLAATSPMILVQNSVGLVWPQLLAWSVFLIAVVPLKWFAIVHWGPAGGPGASSVLYLLLVIPLMVYGMRRALREAAAAHATRLIAAPAPDLTRGNLAP